MLISVPAPQPDRPSPTQALVIWITTAAVFLVATQIAVAAALAPMGGLAPGFEIGRALADNPWWLVALATPGHLVLAGSVWFWVRRLQLPTAHALPSKLPTGRQLAGSLLLIFGLWPLAAQAGTAVGQALDEVPAVAEMVTGAARNATTGEFMLLILAIAALPALTEEALFRGLLTAPFVRSSPLAAVLLPAVLFGLFHLDPIQIAATTVLGVGFGLIRTTTHSIVPSVIAHFVYNSVVLTVARLAPLDQRGQLSVPPMWALLLGLLLCVAGILLLHTTSRSARGKAHSVDGPSNDHT